MFVTPSHLPPFLRRIAATLRRRGFPTYVVGGAVRELLEGRSPEDWDLATAAAPAEVLRCFRRVVPTGLRHGTVLVIEEGQQVEVSTFRTASDGASPARGAPGGSSGLPLKLLDDLASRDFTVNAMALDPGSGALVDPQNGLADLRRGRLRAVGTPEHRFAEDPLRLLRAARFLATHPWRLHVPTRRSMPDFAPQLRQVAPERLRQELERLLLGPQPARGLELMRRTGQLAVVLPELAACVGVRQNRYHAHDVYHHTLRCVAAAPADPALRWAALLHDVGKPPTKVRRRGRVHFYGHEQESLRLAESVLQRLRFSHELQERVLHLVAHHLIGYTSGWSDAAVRRFIRRLGEEHVESMLTFARADALARGRGSAAVAPIEELARRVTAQLQRRCAFHRRQLAVDGRTVQRLLGIGPGPQVGAALAELLDYVNDDPRRNTKRHLGAYLRRSAEHGTKGSRG